MSRGLFLQLFAPSCRQRTAAQFVSAATCRGRRLLATAGKTSLVSRTRVHDSVNCAAGPHHCAAACRARGGRGDSRVPCLPGAGGRTCVSVARHPALGGHGCAVDGEFCVRDRAGVRRGARGGNVAALGDAWGLPRSTREKFEVAGTEPQNPIKQDVKKGRLRCAPASWREWGKLATPTAGAAQVVPHAVPRQLWHAATHMGEQRRRENVRGRGSTAAWRRRRSRRA